MGFVVSISFEANSCLLSGYSFLFNYSFSTSEHKSGFFSFFLLNVKSWNYFFKYTSHQYRVFSAPAYSFVSWEVFTHKTNYGNPLRVEIFRIFGNFGTGLTCISLQQHLLSPNYQSPINVSKNFKSYLLHKGKENSLHQSADLNVGFKFGVRVRENKIPLKK